ncbi:MAG: hypothetical protein QXU40_02340 [Candidatus Pacearchaeota archaeon]
MVKAILNKAKSAISEKIAKQLEKVSKLLEKSLEKSVEVKKLEEEKQGFNIKNFEMMKMINITVSVILSYYATLNISIYLEIILKSLLVTVGGFSENFVAFIFNVSNFLVLIAPLFITGMFVLIFISSYSETNNRMKKGIGKGLAMSLITILFLMFLFHFSPFFVPYLDEKLDELKNKIQSEQVKEMLDIFSEKKWESVTYG